MSQQLTVEQVSRTPVVYTMPGTESVAISRDLEFRSHDGQGLTMDLYRPVSAEESDRPAVVVLVAGYPDPGVERILGCKFKEMASSVSWARLIAASGIAAVVSTNRQPEQDMAALLGHLATHGEHLRIDPDRLGIWATSGNAPLALAQLLVTNAGRPRCATLLYPLLMDLNGATAVVDSAAAWRFVNACHGHTLSELASDVPMLVARAGQDRMPGLNETLDRFAAAALAANLPLTVINHPNGPHAFDLFDDSPETHRIVKAVLTFLQSHLRH